MHRNLIPLAFLAACTAGDDTAPNDSADTDTQDTDVTGPAFSGVMRNCPTDVGNICPYAGAGYNGWNGDDVDRLDAWFSFPTSVVWPPSASDRPVIFDWNNHKIRAVNATPEEGFETIMGTEFLGDGDPLAMDLTPEGADGVTVALNHPTTGQFYSDGTLLAVTWHTHKLRTWDPVTKNVHVVLGGSPGWGGVEFGQAEASVLMNQPKDAFIDSNDENIVYYVDMRNERVRRWDDAAGIVDTVGGTGAKGVVGSANSGATETGCTDTDTTTLCCPDGFAVTEDGHIGTCFNFPKNANPEPGGAIVLSADSDLMYVADSESHAIRVIDLSDGTISTLSGTPGTSGFADGPAADALWYYPTDLAIDHGTNTLFVADANNHRVRAIDLTAETVSTVAGTGEPSCPIVELLTPAVCANQHDGGDGGPATAATVYRPFGVDLDPDGNLVIADTYNHRFRVVYR